MERMNLCPMGRFLALSLAAVFACAVGRTQPAATSPAASAPVTAVAPTPPAEPALNWHDVTAWGAEGRAWPELERKRWFDRLPAVADGKVTPAVWNLSRDNTSMLVRFKTDAPLI